VGVFPEGCTFSVRDQAGHSFTFKDEKEAKGKTLAPGSWSLFGIKCARRRAVCEVTTAGKDT
jgi:hypothetical protein